MLLLQIMCSKEKKFRNIDTGCISSSIYLQTIYILYSLSPSSPIRKDKACDQIQESILAKCLTLSKFICLSKPYFQINKMVYELLINYDMQCLSQYLEERRHVSSRNSHSIRHSLQFSELHFWLALKELVECTLLRKSVPHTLTLFPPSLDT